VAECGRSGRWRTSSGGNRRIVAVGVKLGFETISEEGVVVAGSRGGRGREGGA
jgi:hypothetical protein